MTITATPTGLDLQEQDRIVTQWSSMVQQYLRGAAVILQRGKEGTVQRPGRTERKLEDSILSQTRKSYGVIDRVSIKFERHGVFVHKGVGRGYVITSKNGPVTRTAKEKNPERERKPYEWFNPVLEQTLPELANKLAEINADAVLNATRMMIK